MAKPHQIAQIDFVKELTAARRHHAAGRVRQAETMFSQLLRQFGAIPGAVLDLAKAAEEMGEAEAALQLFQRAVGLDPQSAAAAGAYGTHLARRGQSGEAVALLKRATLLDAGNPQLHYNLGKALAGTGATAQAVAAYRQACRLDPAFVWAFINLGNALADLGLHDEAAKAYGQALDLDPSNAGCWNNYLLSSQYAEGATAANLFALCQDFEKQIGASLRKYIRPHANRRDPERPLRIGYVSPDFRRHPVGYFMSGVFSHHDKDAFRISAYSLSDQEDDLTLRLKQSVPYWVAAKRLDDKALAQRIRSDGIDILIDLAGHTADNRLTLFAQKPAPLQVTWCGYVGSTGLQAMDAIIADRFHIPPQEEAFYTERVVRLPDSWLCYAPPESAPLQSPPPSLARGHVTFGCFNNPAKISQGAIRLWQRILDGVSGSRLALRAAYFTSDERIGIYRQRFQDAGADTARIDFLPPLPQVELLAAYGDIDIALDPFPYSGGVTTLEALWMGVPVITKSGASFPGRHSTSFLCSAGLSELVAEDEDDYAQIALALAKDKKRLSELRAGLRGRLQASPLLDHRNFTRNLEGLLRGLWRDWCASPNSSR
ncbi:MAG: tetratricopeptide repeat protein [Rhodospirillales bacterium]|nr:tetratricopeptide repeat protein [Rhodospirillales bacterium]